MSTDLRRWIQPSLVAALGALLTTSAWRLVFAAAASAPATQSDLSALPPPVKFARDGDHQNMMDQLGIKKLRPGADPNNQATFDEATANKYPLPDLMTMKDGTKVTTAEQWPARRAEIEEDFAREVYGRIPRNVPSVTWQVTKTTMGNSGGIPTITKTLVGHVDNSSYPLISVDIQASVTTPANATGPVPVMVEFGGGFGGFRRGFGQRRVGPTTLATQPGDARGFGGAGGFGRGPAGPNWQQLLIAKGWGYGTINPGSIQADGPALTAGIIGLTNKGQPRKPDDWGALRAWQWGVSRLLDYLQTDKAVDARQVGIEGLSRYGKAALVTEAFEPRIAVGFIGSSGEGGAKLHRHIFGEAVENLTGGEYYWMAGNFMKYGASEATFGSKTPGDLPVDSNELIALCAPRLTFISYGIPGKGDAKWLDHEGSFMATIDASRVFALLGAKGLDVEGDPHTAKMPPVNQGLLDGQLAWRQHDGGHTDAPNMKYFLLWADKFIGHTPPQ